MYRRLKESTGNILGFKIVGGITKKQKKQICEVVERQIRKSGKIRLFLVIEPRKNMDAESLLFDLNFTLSYADNIERMALIGNKVWEKTWIALFGLFSHIRTQYFDRSEIEGAWKWIYT
jgi:stage II sporulation SpoAA-like protein